MPLTREKRKLNKLIEESDSDSSEHELSYYVNDRIKLMKEVLKVVKPKKIKAMAPSCLKNLENEEINSMLLEELLGISNKRLKYIFNGQNLEEDSSTTVDEPLDVISLDDISDDDLVINIEDLEKPSNLKKRLKGTKHGKCKKEKNESEGGDIETTSQNDPGIVSEKNLMNVLELLELQARARAIKSQLLLENAKVQESVALSKIPTLEEKVGSDDEVIIKTAKAEEIVITSSDEEENLNHNSDNNMMNTISGTNENLSNDAEVSKNAVHLDNVGKISTDDVQELENIKTNISEKEELLDAENIDSNCENVDNITSTNTNASKEIKITENIKISDNDGIIRINLSDDEMKLT